MAEEKQAKRFYVSGRVQGVGYRFFARRVAAQLQALRRDLLRGPSYALVEAVDETDAEISQSWSENFSIEDD